MPPCSHNSPSTIIHILLYPFHLYSPIWYSILEQFQGIIPNCQILQSTSNDIIYHNHNTCIIFNTIKKYQISPDILSTFSNYIIKLVDLFKQVSKQNTSPISILTQSIPVLPFSFYYINQLFEEMRSVCLKCLVFSFD